jgi:hypothetical protein
MVWQEEGLIVRCHSPSIEEDRNGREIEEASCAKPRFPGNRGKGADAELEGKEAEEDVAREIACNGLQRSPDAAGGVARQMTGPLRLVRLVSLLALEANPAGLASDTRAQPRWHHRYPAEGADRGAIIIGPTEHCLYYK